MSGFFILIGCQSFKIKTNVQPKVNSNVGVVQEKKLEEETVVSSSEEAVDDNVGLPETISANKVSRILPKFAFILGPGGAKAFAHIGFLQELQNRKIPIQIISGIEWGAFVGGLYAFRGSINDVQWQATKLKSDDVLKKNFISRQYEPNTLDRVYSFLNDAVGAQQTDKTQIPFACPSLMLSKSDTYIMNKSLLRDVISFCLPLPPLYKPFKGYAAQPMDLKVITQYLRSKGATYIVYVSVMGTGATRGADSDTSGTMLWHFATQKALPRHGVDANLEINVNEYSIMDFDRSRDIINKGADSSRILLDRFLANWGL